MGPIIISTISAYLQTLKDADERLVFDVMIFAPHSAVAQSADSRVLLELQFVCLQAISIVAIYMMTLCDATSIFTCFTILSLQNPVYRLTMYRFLVTWGSYRLFL